MNEKKYSIRVLLILILTMNAFVSQGQTAIYKKILCYMAQDSVLKVYIDTLPDTYKFCTFHVSRYLLPFSEDPSGIVSSTIAAAVLNFSGRKLKLRKLYSCGYSNISPYKVFFSDIVNNMVNVEIGYDEQVTSKDITRSQFFFPTFLSVWYKIEKNRVTNIKVSVYHN